MILVDANLLLYAYDRSSQHHSQARAWLEQALSSHEIVGLAWLTVLAFLRISTSPKPLAEPFSTAEAAGIVSEWFGRPGVKIIGPEERHWSILRGLFVEGQIRGPLVTDAHLAALAIEHGAVLYTTDADFRRFPGLKLVNPLRPA